MRAYGTPHRVELAMGDTKKCSWWLQQLYARVTDVMKELRSENNAKEFKTMFDILNYNEIYFRIFYLCSETRFIDYAWRTYHVFLNLSLLPEIGF